MRKIQASPPCGRPPYDRPPHTASLHCCEPLERSVAKVTLRHEAPESARRERSATPLLRSRGRNDHISRHKGNSNDSEVTVTFGHRTTRLISRGFSEFHREEFKGSSCPRRYLLDTESRDETTRTTFIPRAKADARCRERIRSYVPHLR